jgi:hypothetical protein
MDLYLKQATLLVVAAGLIWLMGFGCTVAVQTFWPNAWSGYLRLSWRYLILWPLRQIALLVLWLVSLPLGHANRGVIALQRRLRGRRRP